MQTTDGDNSRTPCHVFKVWGSSALSTGESLCVIKEAIPAAR